MSRDKCRSTVVPDLLVQACTDLNVQDMTSLIKHDFADLLQAATRSVKRLTKRNKLGVYILLQNCIASNRLQETFQGDAIHAHSLMACALVVLQVPNKITIVYYTGMLVSCSVKALHICISSGATWCSSCVCSSQPNKALQTWSINLSAAPISRSLAS